LRVDKGVLSTHPARRSPRPSSASLASHSARYTDRFCGLVLPWCTTPPSLRQTSVRTYDATHAVTQRDLWVRPGNGFGSRAHLWSGGAGLRVVGQVADRLRAHPSYRMPPSHRRITNGRSWKRMLSALAFSFSSGKTMIDHTILRLETYPQDRGTRPFSPMIEHAQ
jgi:hypothetical protein